MLPKLSIVIALLLFISCNRESADYSKLAAFDDLHESVARYSASIETRNINWDSVGEIYRSRVLEDMSELAYFELVSEMLLTFRDPHVWLLSPFASLYSIEHLGYTQNYEEAVTNSYLSEVEQHTEQIRSAFVNDSIGYLFCGDFKGDVAFNNDIYTKVIAKFQDTKGLILDLRINDGGSVYNAQNLINKFATDRTLWHITQNRSEAGFDAPFEWYMEPDNNSFYARPVIVLTGRYTISAGERFSIGAKQLDNLVMVGDTTANTQGSVMGREILNGWRYTLTFEKCFSPSGINYGGIGIPPDYYINAEETIINDRDLVLEKAIGLL